MSWSSSASGGDAAASPSSLSSHPPSSSHHGARVLYPTGDRSSLPGGVLQSANLTPEMLANNLRAGFFPEKGQRIRNTIEQSLARQAWMEVSAVERLHQHTCRHAKLKLIRPVYRSSDAIHDYRLPLPTRLYSRLFKEQPFPHLTTFKPSPLAPRSPQPDAELPPSTQPAPAPLDLATPPSPITFYGPRALGSELWSVDRCGVEQSYLVAYYGDGDAFYSDVYPVNWSGAYDCMRLRIKRLAGAM